MKYILIETLKSSLAYENPTPTELSEIYNHILTNEDLKMSIISKKPESKIVDTIQKLIEEISLIIPEGKQHPLITKTIKVAKNQNLNIDESQLNEILIASHYSDYFNYHSFYILINNDKLNIRHVSDNFGGIYYDTDENNNDFTPESIVETIQKTIEAMKNAEKCLNNSPIQNF